MLTDSAEELDAQGGEDVEEKEEQQSEVADLRQRLHHRVQQSTHWTSHLQQLQHCNSSLLIIVSSPTQ